MIFGSLTYQGLVLLSEQFNEQFNYIAILQCLPDELVIMAQGLGDLLGGEGRHFVVEAFVDGQRSSRVMIR